MITRGSNHRATLDAGGALCYMLGVLGSARVSAGRWLESMSGFTPAR